MQSLRIIHETRYRYRRPVSFGPHRLVLRPREGHDLQIERMRLTIAPQATIRWSRDVFGNTVGLTTIAEAGNELLIVSEIWLRRGEVPRLDRIDVPLVPYPVRYEPLESTLAAAYLVPVYPDEVPGISIWAKGVVEANEHDAASIVSLLNRRVRETIRYNRRDEKGVQSPLQTLRIGSGSCRDMATLLMEGCRALGIASRFSSGYLDCDASFAGRASTHAWAEVYLSGRGWCGFDPTLGQETSDKHIAIGLSNHPRGVMPITGSFLGHSFDYVGMEVSVTFQMYNNCNG